MTYKLLTVRKYMQLIKLAAWYLEKGKIDFNLYDENKNFICSIKIAHGKNTSEEVVAHSVKKTKDVFSERGLKWPPTKKWN